MTLCRMFALSKNHCVGLFSAEIANTLDWGEEEKSVSKFKCLRQEGCAQPLSAVPELGWLCRSTGRAASLWIQGSKVLSNLGCQGVTA